MRVSDIFLNVPLRGGEDRNVAILVEQQHYDDDTFSLKMLELYMRLRKKTRKKTTALAIFTGSMKEVDRFVYTRHKRVGKREEDLSDLPVETITH
jgi:hypothetical protein